MTELELHWKPKKDLAVVLQDMTGAPRSPEKIVEMLNQIRDVVKQHGFDLKHWGEGERMSRHLKSVYEAP